ncbi:hypothetical protein Lal_00031346 [Lupinus albus]|nr:hypothetical protein Lal_00031346 [Lupinus albus]
MHVDLNRPGYKDEPFILASQAQQIFYVSDPTNKKWFIILLTNKIILNNIDDQEDIDAEDDLFFGISLSHESGSITMNDDLYTRDDHDEGVLDSDSDYFSDSIHVSVQYIDFVHSVALSDSEHSENSVHSENMAQPPTPPGPRERILRELSAPDFTYDILCIQYPNEDVPYIHTI